MSVESGAHVGAQFRQLPMFMSAHEIRSQYQGLDDDRHDGTGEDFLETDEELFARKSDESREYPHDGSERYSDGGDPDMPSLYEHVSKHGVENPISLQADHSRKGLLGKPEILGGHHRVAVMYEQRPRALMPVEHFENYVDAQRSLGDRY